MASNVDPKATREGGETLTHQVAELQDELRVARLAVTAAESSMDQWKKLWSDERRRADDNAAACNSFKKEIWTERAKTASLEVRLAESREQLEALAKVIVRLQKEHP